MIKLILLVVAPKLFMKTKYFDTAWKKTRKRIIERDKACLVCQSKKSLHVHHVYNKSTYPRHCLTTRYLVTLCKECHSDFHSWNGGYRVSCTPSDWNQWIDSIITRS